MGRKITMGKSNKGKGGSCVSPTSTSPSDVIKWLDEGKNKPKKTSTKKKKSNYIYEIIRRELDPEYRKRKESEEKTKREFLEKMKKLMKK